MKGNGFYRLIRFLAKALCALLFPMRVVGREGVPQEGPVLLCSNHVSLLDPVLLACALKRPVTYIAKKELFSTRFTRWFFTALGMVSVDRGASDIQALRVCLDVLKEGGMLGIFPQGHRHRQDDHHEVQNGAALMALRSGAPVVAAHVARPRLFRRTLIRLSQPIDFSGVGPVNSQAIQAASDRITQEIWQEEKTDGNRLETV